MKIKLIYILSALLLCGCSPTLNRTYKVESCELNYNGAGSIDSYKIVAYRNGADHTKFGADYQKFYSGVPLKVGGTYVLCLEETK